MIAFFETAILIYFILLNAGYAALFVAATRELAEIKRRAAGTGPDHGRLRSYATLPISVVAPAHNEEATVVESVRSLLGLRYPDHQIIVVNDGSTDATMKRLKEAFQLEQIPLDIREELPCKPVYGIYGSRVDRRLIVLDKMNGGKADALNAGINASRCPLVCAIDADTLMVPDALLQMVRPFMDDARVIAAGGTIRVANGCTVDAGHVVRIGLPKGRLPLLQVVEYMRAFMLGRLGWQRLGGNLIISGAFGLFRRSSLVTAGGYRSSTVGEDMELVLRLRSQLRREEQGVALRHIADPVCFTEVPETLAQLGKQRDRWQRGLVDALWRHKYMILNPRYGWIGMFVMPFFVLFELLGPVIEFLGYVFFLCGIVGGFLDPVFTSLYLAAAVLVGFILSVGGLLLEELTFSLYRGPKDLIRLAWAALIENFGYRQATLWFRIRGLFSYVRGDHTWGAMTRRGFDANKAAKGGRAPEFWLPVVGVTLLLLFVAMPVGWLIKPTSASRVAILDKTVPFEDYREHTWLTWGLSQAKVPSPVNGLLWDSATDYVGYQPITDTGERLRAEHVAGKSLLYIADTYGVYTEDLRGRRERFAALERSKKIVGGLNSAELDVIEAFVEDGGHLAVEFNSFASPTGRRERERLEKLVGVRWSGWIGRYFADLSDEREVPKWAREQWSEYHDGRPWVFTGPGLLLVHEDTRTLVLEVDIAVTDRPVSLASERHHTTYDYWFDIVSAEPDAVVMASYTLELLEEGTKVLEKEKIPSSFPAIVTRPDRSRSYLAGDFADGDKSVGPPWLAGIVPIRAALASAGIIPRDYATLWLFFMPFVNEIIDASPNKGRAVISTTAN